MALLTKKEFAEKCATNTRDLSNYIRRGKVEVGADDLIDDQNPRNQDFCRSRQSRQPKGEKSVAIEKPAAKPAGKVKAPKHRPEHDQGLYDLDKQRKQIDLEFKQAERELKLIEIQKKTGKLIPTDVVRSIFSNYTKALTTEMHQALENHLLEIAKRAKLTDAELASMRGALIALVNGVFSRAVDESQRNVSAIVAEYAQVRSTGERI